MIAKLSEPFSEFSRISRKIDYQFEKIEKRDAELICTEAIRRNSKEMKADFQFAQKINDRVKKTFMEIILNLNKEDKIDNDKFLNIANEYLEKMGYSDSMHAVFFNMDKEHLHLHILLTTIDSKGNWINDSNNYDRSMKITRELEDKYGLVKTDCHKNTKKLTFGECKLREYYVHKALIKAAKDYSLKLEINSLFPIINLSIPKTNNDYRGIWGDVLYKKIVAMLDRQGLFNKLYKDELLNRLDIVYMKSDSLSNFNTQIKKSETYMRLISDKGKTYYVYGLPDIGFYCKDTSLPQKYRYGYLFPGKQKIESRMTSDEQKKYLYEVVFLTLKDSLSYDEFKLKLKEMSVSVIESQNSKGIVGISFSIDVDDATAFKGSEISKRLSFGNIMKHFHGQDSEIGKIANNSDIIHNIRNRHISDYVISPHFSSSKKYEKEQYKILSSKKKKGKSPSLE